ncbi:DNA (cytosine-5-)-methyltransferase, partial [Xanthomonas citri pv. citri]|nr:DNA (cytosine-5-)-methyltransferase [Xanthomonas citri pv. citri]
MSQGEQLMLDTSLRMASFFTGIGGFDLGFENAGIRTVYQCEIKDFCNQ